MELEHEIDRRVQRVTCWISFVLILGLMLLQAVIKLRWSMDARYGVARHRAFYRSLFAIYILYACLALIDLARNYAWPTCSHCGLWLDYINNLCYVTSRTVTWLFMVYRAQMSQGIAPAIPQSFFRYFPKCLCVLWIVMCLGILDNIDD